MVIAPYVSTYPASQLEGEPLPLESDVAATVDPARFLLRRGVDSAANSG